MATVAAWQLGQAAYVPVKAWLAQVLLERSWQQVLGGESGAKPWAWADTRPIARIEFPRLDRRYLVLAGSSGRTLAFGPGHVTATALPGEPGNSVIGGHRDTHFALLRELQLGDVVVVERPDAARMRYRVSRTEVVDKGALHLLDQDGGLDRLTLTTCYPFHTVRAGGPLRYVVIAERNSPLP
jgi:sortase A